MKISKYTFCFDVKNDSFYVYNSLSNSLIEIDKESYDIIYNCLNNNLLFKQKDIDKDLYDVLYDKRFITDNDTDDFLAYKASIMALRASNSNMHLTIAPTMDCIFNCHYCFEQHKDKSYITSSVISRIIKYVKSVNTLKSLNVTWFGGEPLMAIDQMEEFYRRLSKVWKGNYDSNIITTGYHIDKKAIEVLKHIKVSEVQITLDGAKETHNKIKNAFGVNDAFTKVIDNIGLLTKIAPEIKVVIRVNILKTNVDEYVSLYRYIMDRYKNRGIGVAPAIVKNKGINYVNTCSHEIFFNRKEYVKFLLDLFYKENIHSPLIKYPYRFITECAIRNSTAIGFDPKGYAYKCWEVIGDTKHSIGKLDQNGVLTDINSVVLNRQLYGADSLDNHVCTSCKYLPLCNGGCPIERIENEFETKCHDCCSFYKGNMIDFLKAHIISKKWCNNK